MGFRLMQPRFPLGKVYATPGAIALNVDLAAYLRRHHCGDWGDELCAEDKQTNEDSLVHGMRILSRYATPGGSIYIITEWDRSMTTILLPEEY
jgi:hypothetical protein